MNMKPVWAGGFVFVFFLYDLLSTEKGKHWTFWSCTLYYIFPLIKYVKHSKCTVILANTILLYNIFCNNWNLPVYLIQAWRLLCLWQSSAEPKSSKEELYCHLSHVQYTVQMRVCPPWTILCNTDKQQHIQPKVCVCVPSLHVVAGSGRSSGWQTVPERFSAESRFPHRHRLPETLARQNLPPSTHTLRTPGLWLYC